MKQAHRSILVSTSSFKLKLNSHTLNLSWLEKFDHYFVINIISNLICNELMHWVMWHWFPI